MNEPNKESLRAGVLNRCPFLQQVLKMGDPNFNNETWLRDFTEAGQNITNELKEKVAGNLENTTTIPLTILAFEQQIYDSSNVVQAAGTTTALLNIGYELGDAALIELFVVDIAKNLGKGAWNPVTLLVNPNAIFDHIVGTMKIGTYFKKLPNNLKSDNPDGPFKDFINGLE